MKNILFKQLIGENILGSKYSEEFNHLVFEAGMQIRITANDYLLASLVAQDMTLADKWSYDKKDSKNSVVLKIHGSNIPEVISYVWFRYIQRSDDKKVIIRRDAQNKFIGLIFNRCLVTAKINKICQRLGLNVEPFKLEFILKYNDANTSLKETSLRLHQIPVKIIKSK
jgi:hypothetical protein